MRCEVYCSILFPCPTQSYRYLDEWVCELFYTDLKRNQRAYGNTIHVFGALSETNTRYVKETRLIVQIEQAALRL